MSSLSVRKIPSVKSRISRSLRASRLSLGHPSRRFLPPTGRQYGTNFSDSLGKRCVTAYELNRIPQCCPCPGDEPYTPECICVQQTPAIVCRKNIIWVQKVKQEPAVINSTRFVMIPKVIRVARAIRIPQVTWTEGSVRVPKIDYRRQNVTCYDIRQTAKDIMAPQEICTTFLCRPKPQYVLIPPPTDYCCYPLDIINSALSPRYPCKLPNRYADNINTQTVAPPPQTFSEPVAGNVYPNEIQFPGGSMPYSYDGYRGSRFGVFRPPYPSYPSEYLPGNDYNDSYNDDHYTPCVRRGCGSFRHSLYGGNRVPIAAV